MILIGFVCKGKETSWIWAEEGVDGGIVNKRLKYSCKALGRISNDVSAHLVILTGSFMSTSLSMVSLCRKLLACLAISASAL
jgi:hypothetical protein